MMRWHVHAVLRPPCPPCPPPEAGPEQGSSEREREDGGENVRCDPLALLMVAALSPVDDVGGLGRALLPSPPCGLACGPPSSGFQVSLSSYPSAPLVPLLAPLKPPRKPAQHRRQLTRSCERPMALAPAAGRRSSARLAPPPHSVTQLPATRIDGANCPDLIESRPLAVDCRSHWLPCKVILSTLGLAPRRHAHPATRAGTSCNAPTGTSIEVGWLGGAHAET